MLVADAYPNFSICGIPYYISGEVADWRSLAHRTLEDLQATGMRLQLDTRATRIDPDSHQLETINAAGETSSAPYDALIIGTGALPIRPPIAGLDTVGARDPVHLLHSMGDTFALMDALGQREIERAVIVGGGYIGLEMAEALTARGLHVTQLEQLPEVLPTVDPELGALVHAELERHGVDVHCSTRVTAIHTAPEAPPGRLQVYATGAEADRPLTFPCRPRARRGRRAPRQRPRGGRRRRARCQERDRRRPPHAHQPARRLRRGGLCAHLPPPDRARLLPARHDRPQARAYRRGERARLEPRVRRRPRHPGRKGVFDLVAARTGLRDHEASGYDPLTLPASADDHKAYYPGSHPIHMRYTADRQTSRLLGLQLVGHLNSEIAKRIDIAATAIYNDMTIDEMSDLDLSYTPPLGSPWDAIQTGAQAWSRQATMRPEPTQTTSS